MKKKFWSFWLVGNIILTGTIVGLLVFSILILSKLVQ